MAVSSVGTKLLIVGETTSDAVAELTSVNGVSMSADTIDTTPLSVSDGFRTFIGSLRDGGEVSITGYLDESDADGQQALLTAFQDVTVTSFEIEYPTDIGYSWSFDGVVTAFTTNAELEDAVSMEATIKISGKPAFADTSA